MQNFQERNHLWEETVTRRCENTQVSHFHRLFLCAEIFQEEILKSYNILHHFPNILSVLEFDERAAQTKATKGKKLSQEF